ncbi:MAG: outer membrane protein assembly factor [Flavobacterium sp.]|uniref:outer membrane protein assembly factor n=1 Tax=Flavobacterium sp. TaxID=239 RepID=UPI003BA5B87C
MKNSLFILFFSISNLMSQENSVGDISWEGVKKMNIKFMTEFIETRVAEPLDSLKLHRDVAALTRLNGVSNVTYKVTKNKVNNYSVTFTVIENWSILPNLQLWTTDEAEAAYRVGLFDYNFLGRNNTVGGYFQSNGIPSYGLFFSAPFLFSANFGLESSFQKLASFEPIFITDLPSRYEYTNTGVEVLGVYRLNYRNSLKLGANFFSEEYQYRSGPTDVNVPQFLEVDKVMIKSNYIFDNLKYDFYLVNGFRNNFFGQYVFSSNAFQNEFIIAWNDLSYFKRVGKTGNLASRLRLGLSSNDSNPFAPFSLDNNLNIRGVGNIIDRGTGVLVFNTEYRTTIYEKNWFVLQGNAFIDSGSWRQPGGNFNDFIDSENFRIYSGIGLRFIHKTIFNATFRIDYGYGITRNSSSGIVFGIGQYF